MVKVRSAGPALPPAKVVAIAPARFRVQFTASAELEEKIQRARTLLRHKIPSGDRRSHNQFEAEIDYGAEFMQAKRGPP